jgi:hypothetical protein
MAHEMDLYESATLVRFNDDVGKSEAGIRADRIHNE